ncbi:MULTISPECIES: DUF1542 domain-containing protein, partial [unclassified Streptococcus]|uniref:DUF1542 domain-containing protein n=1 Tax=unclassified Streptococcus TaxID=2608887 RepID=UPI0010725B09
MQNKKKKFPFETRQRFSIRKFNIGVASVAISSFFVFGDSVSANEVELKSDEQTILEKDNSSADSELESNSIYLADPVFLEPSIEEKEEGDATASHKTSDEKVVEVTKESSKVEAPKEIEEKSSDIHSFDNHNESREVTIPYTVTFVNQETKEVVRSEEKTVTVLTDDKPVVISITLDPTQIPVGYKLASSEVDKLTQEIHELQQNQLLFALVPTANGDSSSRRRNGSMRNSVFRNGDTMADRNELIPRERAVNINHANMQNQADRSVVTTYHPKGTSYSFKEFPDMSIPGLKRPTVIATYPDGSRDEIVVPITVLLYDPVKTFVANPNNLTEAEKQAVVDAIKAVPLNNGLNPTSTFSVANDGTVTVTNYDGSTSVMDKSKTIIFNPDIASLTDETVAKGASFQKNINFTISQGNPTVTVTGLPAGLKYANKTITGNPTSEKGDYNVTVRVRDGAGRESTKSFVIHVTDKETLKNTVNQNTSTKSDDSYTDASQDKKDAYDKAVEDANKVIQNPSASQAEIDAAKQAIEDAKSGLDGKSNIKNGAKDAIDQAANDQKASIDARSDLTTEEKEIAKSQIDSEVTKAKEAVDTATNKSDVESAKNTGVETISKVNPDADTKNTAKQAIDTAVQAKKSEIDARSDLTDEEKEAAKSEVDEKASEAKRAVDSASTQEAVTSAKDAGVTAINSVNPSPVAKNEAKQAIDESAAAKKSEIESRSDLTDEEKEAAKSEVDEKASEAKQAVDSASTQEAVKSTKDSGVTAINSVNPSPVAKPEAKKAVDEAAQAKKDEIDARSDLTDEEKAAAKAQVDAEA